MYTKTKPVPFLSSWSCILVHELSSKLKLVVPFGVAKLRKDGIVHVVDDAQRVPREDHGRRELVLMIRFLRRVDSRQPKQRQAVLPEQGNEVRLECLRVQKMVVLAPRIYIKCD